MGAPTEPALAAPLLPSRYRVMHRRVEAPDVVTLALEPLDQPLAEGAPGQFHMLWVFGVGEVPLSIAGVPGDDGALLHTVRAVGAVTAALHDAAPGAVLGVRGPFGVGWELAGATERDIVLVAGGIGLVPLRSAMVRLLADRDRYGRVALLVGARAPEHVVFLRELEQWRGRADVEVEVTVDVAKPGWRGDVGVVTGLLSRVELDPANTVGLVCGPEVMMRFIARSFVDRGVTPDMIRLSIERNMLCAVAQCGHCQLGPTFVCREGPVLSYERVAPLLRVPEL